MPGEPKHEWPFNRPVHAPVHAPAPPRKKPPLPVISPVKAARLRAMGIKRPFLLAKAAKVTGLPLMFACALVMQETGGGRMEWGHDGGTIFAGGYDAHTGRHWGPYVTKAGYLAYKAERGSHGQGGMQGVGDVQLTYYAFQDRADALGGCWDPYANMLVGFGDLEANMQRYGMSAGIAAYNGTGAAAQRYSASVIALAARFARAGF